MNTKTLFIVAAAVATMITGCETLDKGALASSGLAVASSARRGDRKTQAAVAAGATANAITANSNSRSSLSAQSGERDVSNAPVEMDVTRDGTQQSQQEEVAVSATQTQKAVDTTEKLEAEKQNKLKMMYKDGTKGTVKWNLGGDTVYTSVLFSESYYNHGSVLMLYHSKEDKEWSFRNEVLFRSMEDMEYALNQVSNYLAKASAWQAIAIEKDVVGMVKDDDKTRVILDRDSKRVENFTFSTRRSGDGKINCSIYVKVDKEDSDLGRFRNFVMDGSVDAYKQHVEKAFEAIKVFKAEVKRLEEEAKKRSDTANLFN